jgi:hypothetical protein
LSQKKHFLNIYIFPQYFLNHKNGPKLEMPLPRGPFCVEEREGEVIDQLVVVVGPVAAELDPGAEALRAQVEVLAVGAPDGHSRV